MFSSLCDSHKNSFNRYVHDSRQVSWLSGHHARRAFSLSQWHLRRHSPVHSDEIAQVLHLFPFYPLSMPVNPSNLTGLAQTAAPTAHISLFHYRWGMFKSQFIPEIILKKNVPWHILAPSAVACDMFLLRASAHHWHVSAFLCNREFQGISCYTKKHLSAG